MNKRKLRNILPFVVIILVLAGIPLLLLNYQAKRNDMSWGEVIRRITNKMTSEKADTSTLTKILTGEKIDFLDPVPIGNSFTDAPLISHVQAIDLDGDSLLDVIVCDDKNNLVSWIRQHPRGTYTETPIASDLIAPAHVQVIDFDNDGDKDLLVAVLGMLFPNNDKIGSVVILENTGKNIFEKHLAADKIARVSDVRGGDLDQDGDMDLAVAQFGYDDGETRWVENKGNWNFESHNLQNLSGPINVEIVDIDKDNDLDIISLVSQEWEEIYGFINDGNGNFTPSILYGASNQDFGSSGICMTDLDQDGDEDILYTNGDAFDYIPPQGRPWHGIQWLENKGNLKFEFHRLCDFIGVSNVRPVDVDLDNDIDLFAVSTFNLWDRPEAQSFIWLENRGNGQFMKRDIGNNPTHMITLETGDFNRDGLPDMVTGGMHTFPPYDRMARVTLWLNNGRLKATN